MLIEIKINRNTKKERQFKNLNICLKKLKVNYSASVYFAANTYYSTISYSSI